MRPLERLLTRSVSEFTRLACLLALAGLALMVTAVVYPKPLAVISAMTFGHLAGIAAFGCYLLAVVMDTARRRVSLMPPPPRSRAEKRKTGQ